MRPNNETQRQAKKNTRKENITKTSYNMRKDMKTRGKTKETLRKGEEKGKE